MRIKVTHETTYRYARPPASVTQILRLTPRNHEGQYVIGWRIDVSRDCQLHAHEDAFGNLTHTFTLAGPLDALTIAIEGEVDTQETAGVVRGQVERFPPELYLRETSLSAPNPDIMAFADAVKGSVPEGDALGVLHALLERVHREVAFDTDATHPATTAAEAFALGSGVCQDLTHIFIAAARHLGVPARYVGGYFRRADGVHAQEAGHAWAEAHVSDLGWVGFDPANGICVTDAHVRVAVGLDYLGAAPTRGTQSGGAGETLEVALHVAQASWQAQN